MLELDPKIRNAARALILSDNRVLLIRKQGGGRAERFTLPGGAQEPGESLRQALVRECREETGATVEVGKLLHVADFFKLRDTRPPSRRHLVEFVFLCTLTNPYVPHNGPHPDKHQVEVQWQELTRAFSLPLYPEYLKHCQASLAGAAQGVYLGEFHDHATA